MSDAKEGKGQGPREDERGLRGKEAEEAANNAASQRDREPAVESEDQEGKRGAKGDPTEVKDRKAGTKPGEEAPEVEK